MRFIRLVVAAAAILFLLSTSCDRSLTPEEEAQLGLLRGELAQIQSDVAAAEKDGEQIAGGLLKVLLAVRLEILRTTEALVIQRIHAIESGASISIEVPAWEPRPAFAESILAEMDEQRLVVDDAKFEASQYSGGLLQGLALTQVATEQTTLASLRQRYLAAKYGLALSSYLDPEVARAPTVSDQVDSETPVASSAPPPSPERSFEIVKIDARVTEANTTWSKYAWILTVRNLTDRPLALNATIEFLDDGGFVIDDDREYGLMIPASEEKTFRGYDLIDASIAPNVSSVSAKVNAR